MLCRLSGFPAGFENNFQDHRRVTETTFKGTGGYQKTVTSSLKRVTEMNFTISIVIS
jgi:hypothetical protein